MIERLLRCGLIRYAVEAMAEQGYLHFETENGRSSIEASSFVVCDDPTRIAVVADRIRSDRQGAGTMKSPIRLERLRDSIELSIGEWIVTTQTKYAEPRLFAGRIWKIVNIDESNNTIEIATDQGEIQSINPRDYPWIRSAATISIREARYIRSEAKLSIELTNHRQAWSAMLLAARHGANARLNIDPAIAGKPTELVEIVQRSLPGTLPHQLARRRDPEAEVSKILSSINPELPDLELFPKLTPTSASSPQLFNASERVRHALKSDRDARQGYELLYRYVGSQNSNQLERILNLCSTDLTREIIRHLAENAPASEQPLKEVDDPFDLPSEIVGHLPRQWSEIDIYKFTGDLRTMSYPGFGWNIAPHPPAQTAGKIAKETTINEVPSGHRGK